MKRLILILFALVFVTAQPFAQPQPQSGARFAPIRSMLDTYCISCHSTSAKAGGVAFPGMSLDAAT